MAKKLKPIKVSPASRGDMKVENAILTLTKAGVIQWKDADLKGVKVAALYLGMVDMRGSSDGELTFGSLTVRAIEPTVILEHVASRSRMVYGGSDMSKELVRIVFGPKPVARTK